MPFHVRHWLLLPLVLLTAACESGPQADRFGVHTQLRSTPLTAAPLGQSISLAPPPAAQASDSNATVAPLEGENFAESPNYRLRPFDLINLGMHLEPNVRGSARVDQDGNVLIPLLGPVQVAGMTLHQAERTLERRYVQGDFFQNPQVGLSILEYAPRRVHLLGQIARPGFVLFPIEDDLTLSQAISQAGGIGPIGDRRRIRITRTFEGGGRATMSYNLSRILSRSEVGDPLLEPGDVIYVPEDPFLARYGSVGGGR